MGVALRRYPPDDFTSPAIPVREHDDPMQPGSRWF